MSCSVCSGQHLPETPCDTQVVDLRDVRDEHSLVGREVGSFRIVRPLGRGGMGVVYLAEHTTIGSKVAIKVLHPRLSLDPNMVARFRAEACAVNRVGHDNIVRIFDFGVLPEKRYYMVMEYLDGEPLSSKAVPLPVETVADLLDQLCEALAAAHRAGVVHRDLKPENIFVLPQRRDGFRVKVLDFGIAKLFGHDAPAGQTSADMILGTPEFMAPEQCAGEQVDGRTDLYAAGIIAHWLLVGRVPFSGGWAKVMLAHQTQRPESPDVLNPRIPHAISQVLLRALEKRPEARFATADAFAQAFRAAMKPAAAPAPAPARVPAAAKVHKGEIERPDGTRLAVELSALTRAGAFVHGDELPPMRSRLRIRIKGPDGEKVHEAEVVQHVPRALAPKWNLPAGYAIQLVRELIPARAGASAGPGARVEERIKEFRRRLTGDLYALLAVPADAEFAAIRRAADKATSELDALGSEPLTPEQRQQIIQLLDRVQRARTMLADPLRRAEHDALLGNYRGVARCIAAGLRVEQIEGCRQRFLADRPRAASMGQMHLMAGRAWEAQARPDEAIRSYEQGLAQDPLNLQLHQRFALLRRSASTSGQAA
jgi:hypothetical protein